MDKIIDGLYLGDVFSCSNRYALKKNGITHILTMAAGMRPLYPKEFIYKCVEIYDMPSETLLPHLPDAINFIKTALGKGGHVLVHCYAGVSRSASTIIAYLMVERNMSFVNAATFVRKKRPIIFPNIGFQRQLLQLEYMIKNKPKDDTVSVISKSKKSVRSIKPETRSETRSNYHSNASVYRGKYANKYKLRKSVKVRDKKVYLFIFAYANLFYSILPKS